ncbi:RimK family alpha-L-glutamate ligase [Planctomycetota bacterium]
MKIWILTKKGWGSSGNTLRLIETATEMGINCRVVNPRDFDIVTTREGMSSIYHGSENVELPDCLLPRLGSATTYFARAVTRHLENLGVLVLNSSQSIELSQDKLATLQHLASNNIPIPKTILARSPVNMSIIEKEFSYPLILKTVSGSFGKGVFLCENRSKLQDTLDLLETAHDLPVNVILQEFMKSSKGRDLRVMVIGGRPYGAMLRTAQRGRFKANYSAGGKVSLFKMNPTIEWLAVESARILNMDIAGVDILFDQDTYVVCEVNSAPGFEGFEKATCIDVPREIFEYAKLRLGTNRTSSA